MFYESSRRPGLSFFRPTNGALTDPASDRFCAKTLGFLESGVNPNPLKSWCPSAQQGPLKVNNPKRAEGLKSVCTESGQIRPARVSRLFSGRRATPSGSKAANGQPG